MIKPSQPTSGETALASQAELIFKWLGIPPEDQPPNYYRLLGIPLFTNDADVIEHAADQRMAHLRSLQLGPHQALAQQLMTDVSSARVLLLDLGAKTAYDQQLHAHLHPAPIYQAIPVQQPPPAPFSEPPVNPAPAPTAPISLRVDRGRRPSPSSPWFVEYFIGGGCLGLAICYWLLTQIIWKDNESVSKAEPRLGSSQPKRPPTTDNAAPDRLPGQSEVPELPSEYEASKPPDKPRMPDEASLLSRRTETLAAGQLQAALELTNQIALLQKVSPLAAQIDMIAGQAPALTTPQQSKEATGLLLGLLKQSWAEGNADIVLAKIDVLLRLSRQSADLAIERQAALFVSECKDD